MSNHPHHPSIDTKEQTVARNVLSEIAQKKVRSLAAALDADDRDLINRRWSVLCSLLGQHLDSLLPEIRKLLTKKQAARLERMTSFTA